MPTIPPAAPSALPDYATSVDQFIGARLPRWLTHAAPAPLAELVASLKRHQQLQHELATLLQPLQDIPAFATPLLRAALRDQLKVHVDPSQARWKEIRMRQDKAPFGFPGMPSLEAYARESPLLQRALQNFTEYDAGTGAFFNGTGMFIDEGRLPGAPEAFAGLCRRLDLGAQYQRHLADVLTPDDAAQRARVDTLLAEDLKASMAVAVHRSFLQQGIDATAYATLKQVLAGVTTAQYAGHSVRCRGLSLLGYTLHGAVAFEARGEPLPGAVRWTDASLVRQVLVVWPDDPLHPVRQYPSWYAFATALGEDLKHASYRDYFMRLLGQDDQLPFATTLTPLLKDARPELKLRDSDWSAELFAGLARIRVAQIKASAATLVVPTAKVDRRVHEERLRTLEAAGLTLLGVAASFIPGVGQVMLATTVAQMLGEVFEGVRDLAHGQRQEALEHLLGVAQTLAVGAAISAGASLAVVAFKRSALVERMVPIARGLQYRLWHNDLQPYRYTAALPVQVQVRSDGLAAYEGRLWLRQDGHAYEVQRAAGSWQLRHPQAADAYAPLLEHNDEAAWRLPGEQPLLWQDRLAMLRRLAPTAQVLSDAVAQQVLDIVDLDAERLRGLHAENRRMPAALRDTLGRFELDARIDAFFIQVEGEVALDALDADLYRYCAEQLQGPASEGVSERERVRQQAPRLRQALFEHEVNRREPVTDEYINVLQRDFPGLPGGYAHVIVDQATSEQLHTLRSSARIPLALAEQARVGLAEVRLNRALEGLCLRNPYNQDSARLALALLRRMPGWPRGLSLELRSRSPSGALVERQLAQHDTLDTRILVRNNGTYRVYDRDTYEIDDDVPEPAGLFEAISVSLTQAQRQALGWGGDDSAGLMRRAVVRQALSNRAEASSLIGQVPIRRFNVGQRLADGRTGYPMSGRGAGSRRMYADVVGSLFTGSSDEEITAFLAEFPITGENVLTALARFGAQWRALEATVDAWSEAAVGAQRNARRRIARELRRCWRRQGDRVIGPQGQMQGYRLNLSGALVGELPAIPETVSFSHVVELTAMGNGLSSVPDAFLQRFPRLHSLNLSHNELGQLPSVVTQLPRLRYLYLSHNRINLRVTGTATLGSLTRLITLSMDANPLGVVPDLGALGRLREVRLRNTQLQAFPVGLLTCPYLDMVDLRENLITQLPEELFAADTRLRTAIVVYNNPLSEATWERLIELDRRVRTQELEADGTLVAPVSATQSRQRWLELAPPEQLVSRENYWDSLSAEPGAQDFFRLLGDLSETSDFQHTQAELDEQVWRLIEAAVENAELREQLFELAASPTTCVDSVASSFSTLRVHFQVFMVRAQARGAQRAPSLLGLARRLFRLDQVEQFARADMSSRIQEGRDVDEVEVSLAYRVRLAGPLDLPGQPRTLQFAEVAGVSAAQLQAATRAVRDAEASDALASFISARDFWLEQLRSDHAAAFGELEARFWARLDALGEREQSLPEGEYLTQMNQLAREREQALKALALRLTQEALNAKPAKP